MGRRQSRRRRVAASVPARGGRTRALFWFTVIVLSVSLASAAVWHRSHSPYSEADLKVRPTASPNSEADLKVRPTASTGSPARPVAYAGSEACAACHRDETAKWQASQHHDAMAHATAHTVLGD